MTDAEHLDRLRQHIDLLVPGCQAVVEHADTATMGTIKNVDAATVTFIGCDPIPRASITSVQATL